jgi:hypothetical protein
MSDMWLQQKRFAEQVCQYFRGKSLAELTDNERIGESRSYVLSAYTELSELLETMNWKRHREDNIEFDKRLLLEEAVDVQKYLIGLLQQWGITEEEFQQAFKEKSEVVEFRWRQEKGGGKTGLTSAKKIALVDIDGVLNTYPQCFYDWVEQQLTGRYKFFGSSLDGWCTDPIKRARLKHEYRQARYKQTLPIRKGAQILLSTLMALGYYVVIVTNWPVKKYPYIVYDTLYWLEMSQLMYDYLYFADREDKMVFVKDILPKVSLVIDDKPKILEGFTRQGIKTIHATDEVDWDELVQRQRNGEEIF